MSGWGQTVNRLATVTVFGALLSGGIGGMGQTHLVSAAPVQDGIYLYGEAPVSNQLGKGYLIFQQSGQQLVGALYYPQSEYTCFMGQPTATHFNLQPFEPDGQPTPALQVARPGLHAIATIGSAERRILAACQAEAALLKPSAAITALP